MDYLTLLIYILYILIGLLSLVVGLIFFSFLRQKFNLKSKNYSLLQQTVDYIPCGIVVVNSNGQIIQVNRIANQQFQADQYLKYPINEFLANLKLPDFQTLRSQGTHEFEWQSQCYQLHIQDSPQQLYILNFTNITNFYQQFEAIKNQETLYRTIVEHQTDLICRYKPDGTITFVNKAFVHLAQNPALTKPEDFIGHNFFDFFEVQIAAKLKTLLPTLTPARPYILSERTINIGGEYPFQWIDYGLFKPGTATITEFQSVGQDISRLKAIEFELQKSEDRFRQLLDSQRDIVFRTTIWGELTYMNKAFCETFNVQPETALGKSVRFFALPQDLPDDQSLFNTMRYPPYQFKQVIRVVSAESIRWFDFEAYLITDSDGRWKEIQAVGRDVTERVKREELENRFINLATNFPDLVLILDAKTTEILYKNYDTFFGYSVDEIKFPGTIDIAVHPDDRVAVHQAWEALLQAEPNQTITAEFRVHKPNTYPQEWLWILSRGRLIYDQPNAPRLLFTFSSIEQQKETEQALRQALDAAEQANRTRNEFLASMSHELRTPLNAVIGMTSLLLDTPLNDEQREYVQTIQSSGELLLALVNNILDYFKFHNEAVQIEIVPTDIVKIAENILRLLNSKARERGLDLLLRIEPNVPALIAIDALRFQQILVNLVDNAIKFTEQGFVQVIFDFHEGQLQTRVQDTGIGIAPDKLDLLFKPFSQVETGSKRLYGGTGLGLAICKTLVQRMGGEISVESKPGQGSTFYFNIPVEVIQVERNIPHEFESLPGKHVLLFDPATERRNLIAAVCQEYNITIQTYSQYTPPNDATQPDFILIAGDHDALQVRQLIDQLTQSYPQIPILILYAHENSLAAQQLPQQLIYAFLPRPFSSFKMFQCIAQALTQPKIPLTQSLSHAHQPQLTKLNDLQILIAEDNPINQKMLVKILQKLGYQKIDVVNHGGEAVHAVQQTVYDVIFMDVQMPVMDGLEATRQIRQIISYPAYIIALTADIFNADREACVTAGMNDFLSKPVQIQQIADVLNRILVKPPSTTATEITHSA